MLNAVHSGLLLFARKRHGDAAAAARRALELNPEYNMGLWMLGAAQVFAGEWDAGAESAIRAVNIDIRDPYVHLYSRIAAYGHLGAGRHVEAVDWFQRPTSLPRACRQPWRVSPSAAGPTGTKTAPTTRLSAS